MGFSAAHWIFYRYNIKVDNCGVLNWSALISLGCFGMAANMLFLTNRSILLPWAIHLGWNWNRLSTKIIDPRLTTRATIQECASFNLLEGSNIVMLISLGLFLVVLAYSIRKDGVAPKKWRV